MKKVLLISIAALALFFNCSNDDGSGDGGNTVNDNLPKLSISNVTMFEGDESTAFQFKVRNDAASTDDISVDYNSEEVSAGFDIDFLAVSGTVMIPAGEREAFINVEIVTDIFREEDEQFKIVLSNPVNATISTAEGFGTIRNDDTFVDVPEDGYITPTSYVGYDLAWADEFDGNSIDGDCWTHERGAGGWGNQELQTYTDSPDNSYIADGNLILEAKKEGDNYTSARMITKGKKSFTFGRVDIRAILPEGQGIWPALWMLGENISSVGWPNCGEIDIMELLGHEPSTTHGTGHWGPQGQGWSFFEGEPYNLANGKFSDEFHVFSIIWEADRIEYLVDDNKFFTLSRSMVNGEYPFNNDFFFIFNIAVGGKWPGYPDATTQFPQQMIIDYIRVFQ